MLSGLHNYLECYLSHANKQALFPGQLKQEAFLNGSVEDTL